jgi:xanthine dehydrogenase accessory factor
MTMNAIFAPVRPVSPQRNSSSDRAADILAFAVSAFDSGPVALATLIEIRGGAARSLGSHVAVAADGRFCGYVSGGCVEAAVAAEALAAIDAGRDRIAMFGVGSPFFDIVLPCGGGISVAIHVLKDVGPLIGVLDRLKRREPVALSYDKDRQSLRIVPLAPSRSGWCEDRFVTVYQPETRVMVTGQSTEMGPLAAIARAAGYEVLEIEAHSNSDVFNSMDAYTAVALLHHDLDAEETVLGAALRSEAFYIGALGSTRTHGRRVARLFEGGFCQTEIDRIRAPIGLFGPTRDAVSLALSVLSDIAAARLAAYS